MRIKIPIILILTIMFLAFVYFVAVKITFAEEQEANKYDVEKEQQEEEFPLVVEDIRDLVKDLNVVAEDIKNDNAVYYEAGKEEKDELMNKIDNLLERLADANKVEMEAEKQEDDSDNNEEELKKGNTENESTESLEKNGNEDNDISVNAEYSDDLIQIHEDLQKIMLSIWALAGLLIGSKLISRMFGNG